MTSDGAPQRGRKIPARYANILALLILSIMMTCIVSAISTLRSVGFVPHFFEVWPMAWALSWAIAFPTLIVVMPFVRRVVAALVDAEPPS